jgi:hypothetical protein
MRVVKTRFRRSSVSPFSAAWSAAAYLDFTWTSGKSEAHPFGEPREETSVKEVGVDRPEGPQVTMNPATIDFGNVFPAWACCLFGRAALTLIRGRAAPRGRPDVLIRETGTAGKRARPILGSGHAGPLSETVARRFPDRGWCLQHDLEGGDAERIFTPSSSRVVRA